MNESEIRKRVRGRGHEVEHGQQKTVAVLRRALSLATRKEYKELFKVSTEIRDTLAKLEKAYAAQAAWAFQALGAHLRAESQEKGIDG